MKRIHQAFSFLLALTVVSSVDLLCACKQSRNDSSSAATSDSVISEDPTTLASSEITTTSLSPEETTETVHTSVSVKTDWSLYEPSKFPDSVHTRLSEEQIVEFVPSSDYGAVFPFVVSIQRGPHTSQVNAKYGLFDINGRIVLDAVINEYYVVQNGYMLVTYTDQEFGGSKYGFVSFDGSIYSGISYDEYYSNPEKNEICFVSLNQTGVTVTPFNTETGETGKSFDLKANPSDGVSSFRYDIEFFSGIYHQRYILLSYEWLNDIVDGETGERMLDFVSDYETGIVGRFLYAESENGYSLYDLDEKLVFDQTFTKISELPNGNVILCSSDKNMIIDSNGEIVAQQNAHNVQFDDTLVIEDYIVNAQPDRLVVYDLNLQECFSMPWGKSGNFYEAPDYQMYEYNPFSPNNLEHDPIMCTERNQTKQIVNLQTEASFSLSLYKANSIKLLPNRVLVTTNDYAQDNSESSWVLLDSTNLQVITQGDGYAQVRCDCVNRQYYLEVSGADPISNKQVIDAQTGAIVHEFPSHVQGTSMEQKILGIYDNYFIYSYCKNEEYSKITCAISMSDQNEDTIFRYYAMDVD